MPMLNTAHGRTRASTCMSQRVFIVTGAAKKRNRSSQLRVVFLSLRQVSALLLMKLDVGFKLLPDGELVTVTFQLNDASVR